MLKLLKAATLTLTSVVTDTYSEAIELDKTATLSVQSVIDVNTPAAVVVPSADIDATANTFTKTAHGLTTGVKGQWTTSSALPTGLNLLTDYWAIRISSSVFKVATSYSNAVAGTAVDISTSGTGNQTFTPTAIAGATLSYQRTNIPSTADASQPSSTASDWDDIETAMSVTADAHNWFVKVGPEYRWFRIKGTVTAGTFTVVNYVVIKGDDV